jgi:hypothetical protein
MVMSDRPDFNEQDKKFLRALGIGDILVEPPPTLAPQTRIAVEISPRTREGCTCSSSAHPPCGFCKPAYDPPRLHHPYCQLDRCDTCLADAFALEKWLRDQTGASPGACDILGKYRTWLDRTKAVEHPETEWGWFDPQCFEIEVLQRFVEFWNGEEES